MRHFTRCIFEKIDYCLPMQFLEPWLKGIKAAGCLLIERSGRNLSGSNSSASGPHIAFERCIANEPITAPTPAGTVTLELAGK